VVVVQVDYLLAQDYQSPPVQLTRLLLVREVQEQQPQPGQRPVQALAFPQLQPMEVVAEDHMQHLLMVQLPTEVMAALVEVDQQEKVPELAVLEAMATLPQLPQVKVIMAEADKLV
jgi:hypothetical protein